MNNQFGIFAKHPPRLVRNLHTCFLWQPNHIRNVLTHLIRVNINCPNKFVLRTRCQQSSAPRANRTQSVQDHRNFSRCHVRRLLIHKKRVHTKDSSILFIYKWEPRIFVTLCVTTNLRESESTFSEDSRRFAVPKVKNAVLPSRSGKCAAHCPCAISVQRHPAKLASRHTIRE